MNAGFVRLEAVDDDAAVTVRFDDGDRLKILYFDGDGPAIRYKRPEQGRFQWSQAKGRTSRRVEASVLRLILEGIDRKGMLIGIDIYASSRPRWRRGTCIR